MKYSNGKGLSRCTTQLKRGIKSEFLKIGQKHSLQLQVFLSQISKSSKQKKKQKRI